MAERDAVEWMDAVEDADVLVVVPPFAELQWPSLGVHLLQASARAAGFRVSVLYANLLLARAIGVDRYTAIARAPTDLLAGERVFARAAYGLEPLGDGGASLGCEGERTALLPDQGAGRLLTREMLLQVEAQVAVWGARIAAAIARRAFAIVGATTTFEQTAASVALLRRVKDLRPGTITLLGGANCEAGMAPAVAALAPTIDYVFSGESEVSFPDWLRAWRDGTPPGERVIRGSPCRRLDDLATPDYTEYFAQRTAFLPDAETLVRNTWLPYETSRGCWWGQKHHCTFCGLNGEGITFREKSPERVTTELRTLVERHGVQAVWMADNIMPHAYFRTLVPQLAREVPKLHIFYEQKANLSLAKVVALEAAGITSIQPGIEAVASDLLTLMDKGVTAAQNLALLRYARSVGVYLMWNLLWGLPRDRREAYEQTLDLVRLLHHLQPPSGMYHLNVDRFSPYFERPDAYGLRNVQPAAAYRAVYPPSADVNALAYHFTADYECASHRHPELLRAVGGALRAWWRRWESGPAAAPTLRVSALSDSRFVLTDTRGLPDTEPALLLEPDEALWALCAPRGAEASAAAWALERKLGVMVEGQYVPLAVATPELLEEFEAWGTKGRGAGTECRMADSDSR